MASGDILGEFRCPQGVPPDANPALVVIKNGASTPGETMLTWGFPDGDDYYVDFYMTIPNLYDDGGVDVIFEIEDIGETNAFVPRCAWRRLELTDDFDDSHTYVYNQTIVTGSGSSGKGLTGTISFTTGADMDNVTAGDHAILRVHRNYTDGDDDAISEMIIRKIVIEES